MNDEYIEIRIKIYENEYIERIKELKGILNIKTNTGVIRALIKYGKL